MSHRRCQHTQQQILLSWQGNKISYREHDLQKSRMLVSSEHPIPRMLHCANSVAVDWLDLT